VKPVSSSCVNEKLALPLKTLAAGALKAYMAAGATFCCMLANWQLAMPAALQLRLPAAGAARLAASGGSRWRYAS